MTEQAIYNVLSKRAEQAVVRAVGLHHLRVQIAALYDRRGEAAKRKATGLLHVLIAAEVDTMLFREGGARKAYAVHR